jgi:signal transduction histidine kinase
MDIFTFRIPQFLSIQQPNDSWGWLYWLALLGLNVWIVWRNWPEFTSWASRQWLVFVGLILSTILSWVIAIVPLSSSVLQPGANTVGLGLHTYLLSALPWLLGGSILGVVPGMLIAAFSGLGLALIETRSPFTGLELALSAYLFARALSQSYRTRFFIWLRQAWFAALMIGGLLLPLLFLDLFFWIGGEFSSTLALIISNIAWTWFSLIIPIVLGGFVVSVLQRFASQLFPRLGALVPSPTERSLQARVFSALVPVAILLFSSLIFVTWVVAVQSSQNSIYNEIEDSLDLASQNLPFLLDTGQEIILEIAADPQLNSNNASQIETFFSGKILQVPFFEQFVLLDRNLNTIAAFPISDFQGIQTTDAEIEAIQRAFGGLAVQSVTVPGLSSANTGGQLSYIAATGSSGNSEFVLVGRSQIESNPFARPVLQNLETFSEIGGLGLLLDANGQIVFDSSGQRLLTTLPSEIEAGISNENTTDGRQIIRGYQQASGSEWALSIEVPASVMQDLALSIALPQFLLILLLGGLSILVLRLSIGRISKSIDLLTLDNPISATTTAGKTHSGSGDEISQLAGVIANLKQDKKINELDHEGFEAISQSISQGDPLLNILESVVDMALKYGASAVRLVLGASKDSIYDEVGAGRKNKNYRMLDGQLLELAISQKPVLLANPSRAPLDFGKQAPPAAIAAIVLMEEANREGVLWMAFDSSQSFPVEEIHYYEKLAGLASLAIAADQSRIKYHRENNQFRNIMEEALDPLLISSPEGEIFFGNRAARGLLAAGKNISGTKLRDFPQLSALQTERWTDVRFQDGRVFAVKTLEISESKRLIGIGILMKDTTSAKQAKALRSEFLTTVSHELQDPIKLLRGYLTMLDMTGELNEKQQAYLAKIGENVSGIADLVANLFDLERIENERGLQLTKFSLGELLARVKNQTQAKGKQKQIKLIWNTEELRQLNMEADETLLERAILNLVDQGIRQSPRGEQVEIRGQLQDQQLRLSVIDKGSGIAAMDIATIFDRLGGKNSENENRGSLALSIVKSIVERHGGKVWADSQLGEGSTFYIEIPIGNPLITE